MTWSETGRLDSIQTLHWISHFNTSLVGLYSSLVINTRWCQILWVLLSLINGFKVSLHRLNFVTWNPKWVHFFDSVHGYFWNFMYISYLYMMHLLVLFVTFLSCALVHGVEKSEWQSYMWRPATTNGWFETI